jgi:hypothetical protein
LFDKGKDNRGVDRAFLEIPAPVRVGLKHFDVRLLLSKHEILIHLAHREPAVRRPNQQKQTLRKR